MQHMNDIWRKVREKQTLEEAALRLRADRASRGRLALKLSVSAAIGFAMALMPVAGAAGFLI